MRLTKIPDFIIPLLVALRSMKIQPCSQGVIPDGNAPGYTVTRGALTTGGAFSMKIEKEGLIHRYRVLQ